MYHTLVPQYERLALRREYRLRAFIVLCFALSVAGVIGIVSLSPAFMSASIEEQAAQRDLLSIKKAKDSSGLTAIQQKVAYSQGLLNILEQGSDRPRPSSLIELLVGERGPVKINSIGVNQISSTTATISIGGIAPTRDSLLAFKSRLIAVNEGNKVDLPVSELAKSTNIQFSIRVIHKLK